MLKRLKTSFGLQRNETVIRLSREYPDVIVLLVLAASSAPLTRSGHRLEEWVDDEDGFITQTLIFTRGAFIR